MIQPNEMKATRPMHLHGGVIATTTDVWNMLVASRDGDLRRVQALAAQCPALLTCQYDYTCPLHLAVREGHLELVSYLVEQAGASLKFWVLAFGNAMTVLSSSSLVSPRETSLLQTEIPELLEAVINFSALQRSPLERVKCIKSSVYNSVKYFSRFLH